MAKGVDTRTGREQKERLRRPRPYLSRTQADVEREGSVIPFRAWMGTPEAWKLFEESREIKGLFVEAEMLLWREAERTGVPRLPRAAIPGVEALLERGFAVESDGLVEIGPVSEAWRGIAGYRERGRAGRLAQLAGKAPGLARAKPKPRSRAKPGLSPALIEKPENTKVIPDAAVIKSGTTFALLPEREEPEIKKKKKIREEPPGFTAYWRVYPVHREKPVALEWWTKLHCEEIADQIVAKVVLLKRDDSQWLQGYIKHPHRWLRAHGWEDDPVPFPISRQEADSADFHRRFSNGEITLEDMFSPQPRGKVIVVK